MTYLTLHNVSLYRHQGTQTVKSILPNAQPLQDRHYFLRNLNFSLEKGKMIGLVGQSGSGKSLTALTLLGLSPQGFIPEGNLISDHFHEDLSQISPAEWQKKRGKYISMMFQNATAALNPMQNIREQILAPARLHQINIPDEKIYVLDLLSKAGFDFPEKRLTDYPHQFSGGQRQRIHLAMVLACHPAFLIADEPTTSLDHNSAQAVMITLNALKKEAGLLLITHDLKWAKEYCDEIIILSHGCVVEHGKSEVVFENPQSSVAQSLVNSQISRFSLNTNDYRQETANDDLKEVKKVVESLSTDDVFQSDDQKALPILETSSLFVKRGNQTVISDLSFQIFSQQTVGIIGPSGTGKSSLALALLQLIPYQGKVRLEGIDLKTLSPQQLRASRKKIQLIFQDPLGSFNPRFSIEEALSEALKRYFPQYSSSYQNLLYQALTDVGLENDVLQRFPASLSGGQLQRLSIARALLLHPKLLVLDEPTASLDTVFQKEILQLLLSIQKKHQTSYILISHDSDIIHALSHHVLDLKKQSFCKATP
jgi:microcin C transport system ATP-binding protein